jgi:hypothetical protein
VHHNPKSPVPRRINHLERSRRRECGTSGTH